MTNAIEQSKREMYQKLDDLRKGTFYSISGPYHQFPCKDLDKYESAIESYLELLRQDHEALHETARKRFEDIQSLEAVNCELSRALESANKTMTQCAGYSLTQIRGLEERLANMTAERDLLRNRMQANEAREERCSTSGQTSGENASCAKMDGKTAAILGALLDAQSVMVEYLVPDGIRAKDAIGKMIPILDNEKLYAAMRGFEHPNGGYAAWFLNNDKCMHSFPSGEQCVFCGVGK